MAGSIQSEEERPLLEGGRDAVAVGKAPAHVNYTIWVCAAVAFFQAAAISMTWGPGMEVFNNQACVNVGFNASCSCSKACLFGANDTFPWGDVSNKTQAEREAKYNKALSDGGNLNGNYALVLNCVNFLVLTLLGEMSDSLGRKGVLLVTLMGSAGCCWCMVFLGAASEYMLLMGATAAMSLTGGQFAQTSGVFAVVADVTANLAVAERTIMFAKVVFPLYFGIVVGPLVIGTLILEGIVDPTQSFHISAATFTMASLVCVVLLPETRTKETRTAFNWVRANPFGGIALLLTDSVTRMIIGLEAGAMIALVAAISVVSHYLAGGTVKEQAFTSYFYAALFFAVAIGNLILPACIHQFGIRGTIRLGTLFAFIFFPLLGLPQWVGVFEGNVGIWSCVFCLPQAIGGMWDAPCRTLTVSRHKESQIGVATAGLVSLQCIMQGITAKAALSIDAYGRSHDAFGGKMVWLAYAFAAVGGLLSFACAMNLPDINVGKLA